MAEIDEHRFKLIGSMPCKPACRHDLACGEGLSRRRRSCTPEITAAAEKQLQEGGFDAVSKVSVGPKTLEVKGMIRIPNTDQLIHDPNSLRRIHLGDIYSTK